MNNNQICQENFPNQLSTVNQQSKMLNGLLYKHISTVIRSLVKRNESMEKESLGLNQEIEEINSLLKLSADASMCSQNKEFIYLLACQIAEQKRLHLAEEKFSKVFNTNPFSMSIRKLDDWSYVDINSGFEKVTGYCREEVLGKKPWEINFYVEPDKYSELRQELEKKGFYTNWEIQFNNKFGQAKIGLCSAEVIELDGKKYILGTMNDITEHKTVYKEMEKMDRLKLIAQMAAGISHEMRNPMTVIKGFLQMLEKKDDFSKYGRYFQIMLEEIDRCNSIITEFISVAKNRNSNMERKNINDILSSLHSLMLADAFKEGKDIILKKGTIPDLVLDEKEISQLILNLVRNGLEAMFSAGTMKVETYMEKEEVVLAVTDQGEGIKEELLDKIGTPFFTTRPDKIGLGLAICHSIAHRHNANIEVKVNPAGTTFYVKFKGKGYH